VYAVWELTLACDLHCQHCGSRAGRRRPRELTTEECLEVVRSLARLETREVTLIGGEVYLRKDWLTIIQAIADAGIECSLQSGARHLTRDKLEQAKEAGLAAVGVSLNGLAETHDRVRGSKGSFAAGIEALRNARDLGMRTAVNTQVVPEGIEELPGLLQELVAAGVQYWRLSIVAPMGNATDHPELMLQPHQLLDFVPRVGALFEEALKHGIHVEADNGLGYFGPYEHLLRAAGHEDVHWSGCQAGVNGMGIESDGRVKACPSLPTHPYAEHKVTDMGLEEIWRGPSLAFNRGRSQEDLWGFCRSCYYADVCRGGCSWMAHTLLGKPGNNPYCHHRALELARQGLRERVERLHPGPGKPYDYGRFVVVLEHTDGTPVTEAEMNPVDGTTLRDVDGARGGGWSRESLVLCHACKCHVYPETQTCPHCGADVPKERARYDAALEKAREAHDELVQALRALAGE
jgi:radical SAM protein with 4Fe4S-binding SPASM domain